MPVNRAFRSLTLGLIVLLASLLAACTHSPSPGQSVPSSTPGPEEHEERAVSMSSLAWELEALVLRDGLLSLLEKYPISKDRRRGEEVLEGWTHEFVFGKGGNFQMVSVVPADNVYQAKASIENAISLLTQGKLPADTEPRLFDKNEVLMMLTEARSLLDEQLSFTKEWQEADIRWAQQQGLPIDIRNEATIADIIETYDDYRHRLSTVIGGLDRILSELSQAAQD